VFDPGPCVYMEDLVVSSDLREVVDLTAPVATNLQSIADHCGLAVEDLTCASWTVHDTSRDWSRKCAAGARIKFILDGDVAGAIMAAEPSTGVDVMIGVGGTPEGVLAACARKCLAAPSSVGSTPATTTSGASPGTPATS
jgi:fructose-1,6-bisphosphatase II